MTPAFALDLTHDSIRLLRRGADGWQDLGGVALDDPQFAAKLSALRDEAKAASSEAFETLLIIPESQILYTTVVLPGSLARIRDADVASALEGLTPLAVDELAFDWRQTDEGIRVAVLEINTLDEAESFAAQYGFNPVGFTADSAPQQFPGAPDFGPLRADRGAAAGDGATGKADKSAREDGPSETGGPADAASGDAVTFASVRASDMDVVKTPSPAVAIAAEASERPSAQASAAGPQDAQPA
ncbi:MAG: hypothetical protein KJN93_02765, partial [Alphaproteobacteria bacterium]|nr:hypothetical protein [Alphaproteobacteria bacterium]